MRTKRNPCRKDRRVTTADRNRYRAKKGYIKVYSDVGKYSDIQELTYENVHEFIDRILIHELDRETNTRKIEIHYSFVGQVDTEQEPTQVVNHDRRNMVDVKSIAI